MIKKLSLIQFHFM